jgi:hypothetical protein
LEAVERAAREQALRGKKEQKPKRMRQSVPILTRFTGHVTAGFYRPEKRAKRTAEGRL